MVCGIPTATVIRSPPITTNKHRDSKASMFAKILVKRAILRHFESEVALPDGQFSFSFWNSMKVQKGKPKVHVSDGYLQ